MPGLLRKIGPEAARIVRSARAYRSSPFAAAARYWRLYRRRRFSPIEIHFLRLLDPALDLRTVVSKEELLAVQRELNPPALHALTEDKLEFHARCTDEGLSVPRIYALYDADRRDPDPRYPVLRDERDVQRFLDEPPAGAFILKPVSGVHGEGVSRLARADGTWRDHNGTPMTARNVVAHCNRSGYRTWMMQALVVGNAELRTLSGAEGLQTVRVVTVTEDDGAIAIVAARLRLISGNTAHDNFDYGRTGNLIANLDVASGVIRSVIGGAGDPCAIRHVAVHPRTGTPLLGVRVPRWQQARDLVERAARIFAPLRTIGWDVAITDAEPCLIPL